jgi:phage terminase large subunit-like protein
MPEPVPPEWMRGPADDSAVAQGCYFDAAEGQRYCDFIETFCCLWEGEWAGQPLKLIPWERDALMRLFGWRQADGRRRFRTFYLEVGKKNGKSPLLAAVVIALTILDGEGGPKAYLNASDREQARIIFETVKAMVEQSPELGDVLEIIDSRNRVVCESNRGVIIANSATVNSKDGRNASLVVFDELHQQRDRKLWSVFLYAGASRRQSLRLAITTAGEDETGIWFAQRVYSEAVNAGTVDDTTHLGIVYRALPTDDVDDEKTWEKANPSLDYTLDRKVFALELAQAKADPFQWNDFLRFRLNIVARSSVKYFDMQRWGACACDFEAPGRVIRPEDFRGWPAYMGLDLASISDFTALVMILGDERSGLKLFSRFWIPEGRLTDLENETKQPYKYWADKGYLTPTPGRTTDYGFLRKTINSLNAVVSLSKIIADRHNATQLCTELVEEDGLPLEYMQQGFISLNDPTKQFKRWVEEGLIEHDGNPVMTWCISNAVADKDAADNVKLNKGLSRQKIDGAAAGINATAAVISDGTGGPSVYEGRGILTL